MTQANRTTDTSAPKAAPVAIAEWPGDATSPAPPLGRQIGVDLARALAVFGMYIVHMGPPLSATSGVGTWVAAFVEGRSSILFATLAGLSLTLLMGGQTLKVGWAGRQAKVRIAIRAVILLALGFAMIMVHGDVVILASYGVFFLIVLPLVKLQTRTLVIIATAMALIGPQIMFALNAPWTEAARQAINAYDPFERITSVGVVDLLLTGAYPAVTWIPFVIAGMTLGRLDLTSGATQRRLAIFGPTLIVLGYGASLLLAGKTALNSLAEEGSSGFSSGPEPADKGPGPDLASIYLTAGPHSGTTFEILGSLGVAITVILLATVAMQHLTWLRRLLKPVIAVGTMSLTAYVSHFMLPMPEMGDGWIPVLAFIVGITVFAAMWSQIFRRGPLEYLLHSATKLSRFVR